MKNLFDLRDEITLGNSSSNIGFTGNGQANGCVDQIIKEPYGFKTYVPKNLFLSPSPMITKFLPGHDTRVQSQVPAGSQETLDVEIHFSAETDCESVTSSTQLNSTTEDLRIAAVQPDSVVCGVSTT